MPFWPLLLGSIIGKGGGGGEGPPGPPGPEGKEGKEGKEGPAGTGLNLGPPLALVEPTSGKEEEPSAEHDRLVVLTFKPVLIAAEVTLTIENEGVVICNEAWKANTTVDSPLSVTFIVRKAKKYKVTWTGTGKVSVSYQNLS